MVAASTVTAARGERVTSNERNYAIVDELIRVAREVNSTPAAVALAWVQTRPGVTSTIIGARRLDQLDQNLAALDVTLDAAHVEALNLVSKPALNFPAGFLAFARRSCRPARPSTESRRKCRRSCRSRTRSGTESGTGRMSSTAPTYSSTCQAQRSFTEGGTTLGSRQVCRRLAIRLHKCLPCRSADVPGNGDGAHEIYIKV